MEKQMNKNLGPSLFGDLYLTYWYSSFKIFFPFSFPGFLGLCIQTTIICLYHCKIWWENIGFMKSYRHAKTTIPSGPSLFVLTVYCKVFLSLKTAKNSKQIFHTQYLVLTTAERN